MQPYPLDLFGDVPVMTPDIDAWLIAVRGIAPGSPRAAAYLRNWDVAGKVRRAKLDGPFDATIAEGFAQRLVWHPRLELKGASLRDRALCTGGQQRRQAGCAAARSVAESIDRAIDRRYELHARQLATRGDLAELGGKIQGDLASLKTDLLKWSIGTMFAAVALFATITRVWH